MKFMKLLSVILVLAVNVLIGMEHPGHDRVDLKDLRLGSKPSLSVEKVNTLPGWERYERKRADSSIEYAVKESPTNRFNAGIRRKDTVIGVVSGSPAMKVSPYSNPEEVFNRLKREYISQLDQPQSLVNLSTKAVAQNIDDNKITLEQAKKLIPADLHPLLEAEVKELQKLNPNKTRLTPELEKAMQEALEDFEKR